MTKGSALPTITSQITDAVEVQSVDPDTGATISTFNAESQEHAKRYVRRQLRLAEDMAALLPPNLRANFRAPEFLIDGDEFDGEDAL